RLKDLCAMTDGPSAGLVLDLKQRGLLDSTIVLWAGEFCRLPISQGSDGRDHNRHAFSLWVAGGGFKKGYAACTTCTRRCCTRWGWTTRGSRSRRRAARTR